MFNCQKLLSLYAVNMYSIQRVKIIGASSNFFLFLFRHIFCIDVVISDLGHDVDTINSALLSLIYFLKCE